MTRSALIRAVALALAAIATRPAAAQITVTGVEDREVYRDRVSFRVDAEAGWDYTVTLDGEPVTPGADVEVTAADYHELSIERRSTTGDVETRLVRFIVRDSARGNSEWGLPPWVPHPAIPSAVAELDGARLRIVRPPVFPRGLELPLIIFVEDASGRRVGVNGEVTLAGLPDDPIRILRGVGSRLLSPAPAGELRFTASIGPLWRQRAVRVEGSTTWTEVAGEVAVSTDWGEDARVRVTDDLVVRAGATLAIGAGSVVRLDAGVEIRVDGALEVAGTTERPVVLMPVSRAAPWGGLVLRSADARVSMTGTVLTGSGADDDWFDTTPDSGSSHRDEQALLFLSGGARATLTDCWIIDNAGQAGHGEDSFLTMTRCLVQRCITAGQYNRGSVTLESCALIEFPAADAPFEDEDNDGLYLTGGAHSLTDCLVGWALDDGIDAGSGSGGSVEVTRCWIESCYHEGMAWSEARDADVRDTVAINNGQGIECGFDDPDVLVERCLSTANLVGARFGDNYDWDYEGFLRVTESLLLHNRRDVWGRTWDTWEERLSQMDVRGNFLTVADPLHPANTAWEPERDAPRLEPFLPTPGTTVGVGIALRDEIIDAASLTRGVPVRLSTFTTRTVTVGYSIENASGPVESGTLEFTPGETVRTLHPDLPEPGSLDFVVVRLAEPDGAEITGRSEVFVLRNAVLVARGSVWRYSDGGIDEGTAWRESDFDDSAWSSGPAELGYGDGDEATVIDGGPSGERHPTVYFRHRFNVPDPAALARLVLGIRRDDGAVVYLNGAEVHRTNMPAGEILFGTFALSSDISESAFETVELSTDTLVPGSNVLAVDVHQANAESSDVSFDLELVGVRRRPALPGEELFVRGDVNGDGGIEISDAVRVLIGLFLTGEPFTCDDAADANDDGAVQLSDAMFILSRLFLRGAPLPPPSACGIDSTPDELDCAAGPCP